MGAKKPPTSLLLCQCLALSIIIALHLSDALVPPFHPSSGSSCRSLSPGGSVTKRSSSSHLNFPLLRMSETKDGGGDKLDKPTIVASPLNNDPTDLTSSLESSPEGTTEEVGAVTNTVNARLQAEIEASTNQEKYGAKSKKGRLLGLTSRPQRTDEEIEASLAAARDLNGVNPTVTFLGSLFAFAFAFGLWSFTNFLAELFATHPVMSDAYFVQRLAQVFRNVVMGMVSLASGFFGVTGMGIFLLSVRVAYGVMTGELDPTPIVKPGGGSAAAGGGGGKDELELPNVWDLMMGKKPGRRR